MNIKPVLFVNFSDQPFSGIPYEWPNFGDDPIVDEHCKWNGEPDSFKPHESRYMEDWRAAHYAKHLINRELDKQNKPTSDMKLRAEMLKKCIIEDSASVVESHIDMTLMNKNMELNKPQETKPEIKEVVKSKFCEFCDSKGVRHLKNCPTLKSESTEEFADLKNAPTPTITSK